MKYFFYFAWIVSCTYPLFAQTAKDSTEIRITVLNYIEGWYEGNPDRMKKAVHPNLVKRIVGWSRDYTKNENVLSEMTAIELIDLTRKRSGTQTPRQEQLKNITILDMYNNTASVKAEMRDWIDYLHLARWNGEWKIINVLWEMKPQQ
jgi:hypothetical protein